MTVVFVRERQATRHLPQTGGGVIDKRLLEALWTGAWMRGGVSFTKYLGKSQICKFPTSGKGMNLRICGARAKPLEPYCPRCMRLAYYAPRKGVEAPRETNGVAIPDHVVVDLLGQKIA